MPTAQSVEIEYPLIWDDATTDAAHLKIMAIKSSAKKVFWQLSNASSNMYESVYYHHKVLTAESMFRKMLKKLYQIEDEENQSFTKIMRLTDDLEKVLTKFEIELGIENVSVIFVKDLSEKIFDANSAGLFQRTIKD